MKWSQVGKQECSAAKTLSVVGDRWTRLILREVFQGATRFDQFREGCQASRAIVADRLTKLLEHDFLIRVPYQEGPVRYDYGVTPRGLELLPVLLALQSRGDKWLCQKYVVPLEMVHLGCGKATSIAPMCAECKEPIEYDLTYRPGPGSANRRGKSVSKKKRAPSRAGA